MGARCPTRAPPPAPPPEPTYPLAFPIHWTQARRRWKIAVERIVRILRVRYKWYRTGVYLQQPFVQSLVEGLERKRGRLVRTARVTSTRA